VVTFNEEGALRQPRENVPRGELADQRPWAASFAAATRQTYDACGSQPGRVSCGTEESAE
jgi:hypothetical protein